MPSIDQPAIIVARYLKANHYAESYEAFINEAGLPIDAGDLTKGALTLETLLDEKNTFDVSLRFERLGFQEGSSKWTDLAPTVAHVVQTLPTASGILSIGKEAFQDDHGDTQELLLVSTADRQLHILDACTSKLRLSASSLHDSPILSSTALEHQYIITASMSGQLLVSDLNGRILENRRDHSKYVVKIARFVDGDRIIIATAGWDKKITLYQPSTTPGFTLGEPTATITTPTKPEAILLLRHPDNSLPILLVSCADSTYLFFYTTNAEPRLLGKQNLAPHSNAWIAFTPSALALHPHDPSLVAVATSSVPHMKLLIVRLLFPPWDPTNPTTTAAEAVNDPQNRYASTASITARASLSPHDNATTTTVPETQASQARAALALADREEAAIRIQCNTMASQTAYSTPAVAWRPDGSGVWVNGDDGLVRGIEAATGKVVSTLLRQGGHAAGSKVRCLWAGNVRRRRGGCIGGGSVEGEEEEGEEEILVSGGFDQKLIVWKTA